LINHRERTKGKLGTGEDDRKKFARVFVMQLIWSIINQCVELAILILFH